MTKRELVEKLSARVEGLSLKESEQLVNTVFESMTEALASGDRIEIRGFGSFLVKERQAKQGRNPRTGESVAVKAKKVPFFKPGKNLREKVDTPD